MVKTSLNLEGRQNCITGSKLIAILLDRGDFAYWWSCIGNCSLQCSAGPAQQACFYTSQIFNCTLLAPKVVSLDNTRFATKQHKV